MANPVTSRFIECHDLLKSSGTVKSSRQFAKSIGTLPQSLNEVLKGKRDATVSNLMQLVHVYGISAQFLLAGEGAMFICPVESEIAKEHNISYVPMPAHAGYTQQFQEAVSESDVEKFSIPGYHDSYGEHRCFDVEGASMEPSLYSGDMIICSRVPSSEGFRCIKDHAIYVVITDTDVLVKRLVNKMATEGCLQIISDNDFYPSESIPATEVREVWRVNMRISRVTNTRHRTVQLNKDIAELHSTIKNQAQSIAAMQKLLAEHFDIAI